LRPAHPRAARQDIPMQYTHAFKLALGALWTAGHDPDNKARNDLLDRCANLYLPTREAIADKAISELDAMGYELAENPDGYRLLKPVRDIIPQNAPPSPGHGVRTYGSPVFKDGEIVFIEGDIGDIRRAYTLTARIGISCMTYSCDPETHSFRLSCGSGHLTTPLNTRNFQKTQETTDVLVWRFAFTPEADAGVYFLLKAPVWSYNWRQEDIIDRAESNLETQWTSLQ